MKNIALTCFLFFFFAQHITAQNSTHVLKSGEDINDAVPAEARYYYPKFITGNVMLKDGKMSVVQLNYNLLVGEMQFIAGNGDTLSIANEATIRYVCIGTDSFFYDKLFVQLITGNTTAKLAKNERIKMGDIKKSGAYGQLSSSSSITTYSSLYAGAQRSVLTQNLQISLLKHTTFYIGDTYNNFKLATKKNILKMYGNKQTKIENFLLQNNISFNKEEDLKRLIDFLKELKL